MSLLYGKLNKELKLLGSVQAQLYTHVNMFICKPLDLYKAKTCGINGHSPDKAGRSGAGRRLVGGWAEVGWKSIGRRSGAGRRSVGRRSKVGRRSVGGRVGRAPVGRRSEVGWAPPVGGRSGAGRRSVGRPFYNTIIDSRLPLVM